MNSIFDRMAGSNISDSGDVNNIINMKSNGIDSNSIDVVDINDDDDDCFWYDAAFTTNNIDEALRSLYTMETTVKGATWKNSNNDGNNHLADDALLLNSLERTKTTTTAASPQTTTTAAAARTPSSSYVPREEYDWLLDGGILWQDAEAVNESHRLIQEQEDAPRMSIEKLFQLAQAQHYQQLNEQKEEEQQQQEHERQRKREEDAWALVAANKHNNNNNQKNKKSDTNNDNYSSSSSCSFGDFQTGAWDVPGPTVVEIPPQLLPPEQQQQQQQPEEKQQINPNNKDIDNATTAENKVDAEKRSGAEHTKNEDDGINNNCNEQLKEPKSTEKAAATPPASPYCASAGGGEEKKEDHQGFMIVDDNGVAFGSDAELAGKISPDGVTFGSVSPATWLVRVLPPVGTEEEAKEDEDEEDSVEFGAFMSSPSPPSIPEEEEEEEEDAKQQQTDSSHTNCNSNSNNGSSIVGDGSVGVVSPMNLEKTLDNTNDYADIATTNPEHDNQSLEVQDQGNDDKDMDSSEKEMASPSTLSQTHPNISKDSEKEDHDGNDDNKDCKKEDHDGDDDNYHQNDGVVETTAKEQPMSPQQPDAQATDNTAAPPQPKDEMKNSGCCLGDNVDAAAADNSNNIAVADADTSDVEEDDNGRQHNDCHPKIIDVHIRPPRRLSPPAATTATTETVTQVPSSDDSELSSGSPGCSWDPSMVDDNEEEEEVEQQKDEGDHCDADSIIRNKSNSGSLYGRKNNHNEDPAPIIPSGVSAQEGENWATSWEGFDDDGNSCLQDHDDDGDEITTQEPPRRLSLSFNIATNDTDDEVPASLLLPLEDMVSSPLAKFTRRRQLLFQQQEEEKQRIQNADYNGDEDENDDDSVNIERNSSNNDKLLHDLKLPDCYFNQGNPGDTVSVLKSLPWHFIHHQQQHESHAQGNHFQEYHHHHSDYELSELALWDESMTLKLCELDGALENIQGGLRKQVKKPRPDLAAASSLIHEWDQNLRLAFMYSERTQDSIKLAAGIESHECKQNSGYASGLVGPTILLQAAQQREEYQDLARVLRLLEDVQNKEQDLWTRIDSYDTRQSSSSQECRDLMALAKEVHSVATQDKELSVLHCLDNLRSRVTSFSDRLSDRFHTVAESVAVRCCRGMGFEWEEYERLVLAMLHLQSHWPVLPIPSSSITTGNDSGEGMLLAESWSDKLIKALCYEADRSLAAALLDPTETEESDFEKDLAQIHSELELGWGDNAKLRTLTHNLVTIRFDFEVGLNYLPRVFHRLCQSLADVLYAHFQFTQWHDRYSKNSNVEEVSKNQSLREEEYLNDDRCRSEEIDISNGSLQAMNGVLINLKQAREKLWNKCESVLGRCLDEYLNFSAGRKLFERDDQTLTTDDSVWQQELHCLHQVLLLTDRFINLKKSFFEDFNDGDTYISGIASLQENDNGPQSILYENLTAVFRKHLRRVHVEAMNTMGRLLSKETWILVSLSQSQNFEYSSETEQVSVENLVRTALNDAASLSDKNEDANSAWTWMDERTYDAVVLDKDTAHKSFARFAEEGNPFTCLDAMTPKSAENDPEKAKGERSSEVNSKSRATVLQSMNSIVREKCGHPRIVSESIARGFLFWVSRLLQITKKLSIIAQDVPAVFAHICDLYCATVLRLCSGNFASEKLLLGIEQPDTFVAEDYKNDGIVLPTNDHEHNRSRSSGPQFFDSFRSGNKVAASKNLLLRQHQARLKGHLNAEISAPLPGNDLAVSQLRVFIERAHANLKDAVNLDMVDQWLVDPVYMPETNEEHACSVTQILEKRQSALWSCFAVAAILDETCAQVEDSLRKSSLMSDCRVLEAIAPLQAYVGELLDITPTLVSVGSHMACVRAIGGSEVVKKVVAVGDSWYECKLNEHPNEYVDKLCDRCALIWGFLSASSKLPFEIMKDTWQTIVSCAYFALLDGFARVPFCSTEGRALMALDLASLSAGVASAAVTIRLEKKSLIATPPIVEPVRGNKQYVDAYIKGFYYPKDDILKWIEANHKSYMLNHSLALVAAVVACNPEQSPESSLDDLFETVKSLYKNNSTDVQEGVTEMST